MNTWSFTITATHPGYQWEVHHHGRRWAHGHSGDYNTAWLDSHDTIPDRRVLSETIHPITPAGATVGR